MTPTLQHDISVCFDTANVPPTAFTADGLPSGIMQRPLRKFDTGASRSTILNFPKGWRSEARAIVGPPQQYFVLSGSLRLGEQALKANAFFAGFEGDTLPAIVSDGAELIAIFDGTPAFAPAKPGGQTVRVIDDAFGVSPITPVINGKPLTGFERRVLWENPENGADTRLLRVPAGFKGAGPNYHPVHEEIFMLDGDGGPDDTRRMKAGWFLWNPAYGVHGQNEHSVGGMTLLEWHDAAWSITFHPS